VRLTPGQIADLRSAKNVRGSQSGRAFYLVSIKFETFERVQVLGNLGELHAMWYYMSSDGVRVQLMTDVPEWFVELEGQIEDARRAPR